jgi:hypothetical protein
MKRLKVLAMLIVHPPVDPNTVLNTLFHLQITADQNLREIEIPLLLHRRTEQNVWWEASPAKCYLASDCPTKTDNLICSLETEIFGLNVQNRNR